MTHHSDDRCLIKINDQNSSNLSDHGCQNRHIVDSIHDDDRSDAMSDHDDQDCLIRTFQIDQNTVLSESRQTAVRMSFVIELCQVYVSVLTMKQNMKLRKRSAGNDCC